MKPETTADRLRTIISSRNLRQTDILSLVAPYCEKYGVKMNKSNLSQYVNGKAEPGQNKLTVLGLALNVSEAWLMGYDVPMERDIKKTPVSESSRTDARLDKIIDQYHNMNVDGQVELAKYADYISTKPEYSKQTLELVSRGNGKVQRIEADITQEELDSGINTDDL